MTVRILSALCLLLVGSTAVQADRMAAPVPIGRALVAEVVVVGKVESIEPDTIEAEMYPKGPKVTFHVAVVKIEDALHGAKGLTHIKVAFRKASAQERKFGEPGLEKSQKACLFLRKQPVTGLYTFDFMSQPMDGSTPNFAEETARIKKTLACFADPSKALKAEKAEDRYLAAIALMVRYTTPPRGIASEKVAISAEETKQIFAALLAGDWSKPETGLPQPSNLVMQLTSQGFRPAQFSGNGDYNAFIKSEFQKWGAGPGAKVELKKFVPKSK